MSKKRVMFIASTGGHLEELLQLKSMFSNYDYSLITEKTKSNMYLKGIYKKKVHYLIYGTKHHFLIYPFKLFINCFISLFYYLKYKPDYIITTGVHTAGPMCCIGKIFGSKIIYIETFANMVTKTSTGRLLYPLSDKFIVQWESMKKIYPKATFGGWIF
ncbi:MAG: polysaccharide biosynthesis protein [Bacilli bacterium]|nr:polysaccharide biosynthesis protein [Bacilli bacterium]